MARVAPNISRVLAVEPPDDGAELNSVPIFSTADGALCGCILGSYRNPESLYVIDSLRAPLFETSGPASKNGIIMPFFTQLTRVLNALARSGISVVATVNPMDEDPAFVKGFLAKLSASVPAVVLLEKNDISQGFETFTGIAAVRPKRAPVSFQLTVRARGGEVAQLPDLISEMTLDPVNPFQDIGHANNPMINAIQKEVI
jgi:hypothetical protein